MATLRRHEQERPGVQACPSARDTTPLVSSVPLMSAHSGVPGPTSRCRAGWPPEEDCVFLFFVLLFLIEIQGL